MNVFIPDIPIPTTYTDKNGEIKIGYLVCIVDGKKTIVDENGDTIEIENEPGD